MADESFDEQQRPTGATAVFAPTINGIVAPEKSFATLDARPVLAVWPLLWTVVGMVGLAIWNMEVTRQMMRVGAVEGMIRQGQEPDPEQLAQTFEMMDRFAPFWAIGGNLFILVMVALIAVAFWIGSSLLGGRTEFGRSLGVASVGALIHPLLATAFMTVMWKLDPPEIRRMQDMFEAMPSLGLDLVLASDRTSVGLRTLMARFDLFNIWWVVVTSIGGQRLLSLRKGQAVGIAVSIWLLSALIAAGWASLNT